MWGVLVQSGSLYVWAPVIRSAGALSMTLQWVILGSLTGIAVHLLFQTRVKCRLPHFLILGVIGAILGGYMAIRVCQTGHLGSQCSYPLMAPLAGSLLLVLWYGVPRWRGTEPHPHAKECDRGKWTL